MTIVFLFFIEYFFKLNHLRIPHKIFHHTLASNKTFIHHWGEFRYKICTDNNGFRIKCGSNSYKNFDIAFIGGSMTEGLAVFENTYVGMIVDEFPDLKIANLAVASYSPSIYLTKVRYYLEKGITFKRLIVYMDISDIQDEAIYSIENGKVKDIAYLDEKENIVPTLSLSRRIRNKLNLHFPKTYKILWVIKNLILHRNPTEHLETAYRFKRDYTPKKKNYKPIVMVVSREEYDRMLKKKEERKIMIKKIVEEKNKDKKSSSLEKMKEKIKKKYVQKKSK